MNMEHIKRLSRKGINKRTLILLVTMDSFADTSIYSAALRPGSRQLALTFSGSVRYENLGDLHVLKQGVLKNRFCFLSSKIWGCTCASEWSLISFGACYF